MNSCRFINGMVHYLSSAFRNSLTSVLCCLCADVYINRCFHDGYVRTIYFNFLFVALARSQRPDFGFTQSRTVA